MSTRQVIAASGVGLLLLVVAAALWMSRAAGGVAVDADDRQLDGFRLEVSTYDEPGVTGLAVEVCWTGLTPVRTSSSGGKDVLVAFEVLDSEGEVVADTTHGFHTMELRSVLWFPGQCRTTEAEWDQHYWNRPGVDEPDVLGTPARGARVEPGTYRFRVAWFSARWDETPRAVESVTTEAFQVEE